MISFFTRLRARRWASPAGTSTPRIETCRQNRILTFSSLICLSGKVIVVFISRATCPAFSTVNSALMAPLLVFIGFHHLLLDSHRGSVFITIVRFLLPSLSLLQMHSSFEQRALHPSHGTTFNPFSSLVLLNIICLPGLSFSLPLRGVYHSIARLCSYVLLQVPFELTLCSCVDSLEVCDGHWQRLGVIPRTWWRRKHVLEFPLTPWDEARHVTFTSDWSSLTLQTVLGRNSGKNGRVCWGPLQTRRDTITSCKVLYTRRVTM